MTHPESRRWPEAAPPGYRRASSTRIIGRGDDLWHRAATDLLRWRVKTRSGFRVDTDRPVSPGDRLQITVRLLGLRVVEPVEVVEVVDEPDRVAFSYRTRPGHPLDGEEAFILERGADGGIRFTVRSLSRPAQQRLWRALSPAVRLAQRVAHARYLRALR